ncbi:MAG: hypothetical protein R2729_28715 [Bryobacteraceae bacterium]
MFRGGFDFYTIDVKFPAGREMYDEYQGIAQQQAARGDPTPIYQISRATAPPRLASSTAFRRVSAPTSAAQRELLGPESSQS